MTGKISFVQANAGHVRELRGRLRPDDVLEIIAACGIDPDEALNQSFLRSEKCWAILVNGVAVGLFGVGRPSLMSSVGYPWLLGTVALDWLGIRIFIRSRYYIDEMKRGFSTLENYVDARNVRAVRWLKSCGFEIEPAAPWGVAGLPFHRFTMKGGLHV